jgi:hypothetical protein
MFQETNVEQSVWDKVKSIRNMFKNKLRICKTSTELNFLGHKVTIVIVKILFFIGLYYLKFKCHMFKNTYRLDDFFSSYLSMS